MNKKNHRRNGILRSAFLAILSLALLPPVLSAKERRGAHVLVTKYDGTMIQGELLAVRAERLIIMEESISIGVTSNLMDVQSVQVVKKPKIGTGIGLGLLVGAAAGVAVGILAAADNESSTFSLDHGGRYSLSLFSRGQWIKGGVLSLGTIGAVLGGIIAGGDSRRNVVINISSPEEIEKTILRLRELARDQV
jgi:hypothetical protein